LISTLLKWTRQLRARSPNPLNKSPKKPDIYRGALVKSTRNLSTIVLLSWLSMLSTDFLLHAGLLSWIYLEPSPFLLPPEIMFRLIPLGYLSLLLLAVLLSWLMVTHDVDGWLKGSLFGVKLGGLMGGGGMLGLASISTAEFSLLFGWLVGQTIEIGIAGAVIGSALGGVSTRRLFMKVSAFVIFSLTITVVLQAVELAPAALVISPK
jgi:hypothetical protein